MSFIQLLVLVSALFSVISWGHPALKELALVPLSIRWEPLPHVIPELLGFQFLHKDFWHLLGNAFILLVIGTKAEVRMGKERFVRYYFLANAFVWAGILLLASAPTIGISGLAMALIGTEALALREKNDPEWKGAFLFLAIGIAMGLKSEVSFVWHAAWGAFAIVWHVTSKYGRKYSWKR